jgi:Ni/Fe-hydrogenase subunit HybB-like protein
MFADGVRPNGLTISAGRFARELYHGPLTRPEFVASILSAMGFAMNCRSFATYLRLMTPTSVRRFPVGEKLARH